MGSIFLTAALERSGAARVDRWWGRGGLGGASVGIKDIFTIGYGGSATRHGRDEREEGKNLREIDMYGYCWAARKNARKLLEIA
jgi:hypothetical protein